ncbi:MAG: hypothetical protein E5X80_23425 [Mesorhizobium sp.]|nr:MAG: hypothetical protein EOR71_00120 [Mesorhizobium sp.]TIO54832.1 MAG: hypothetical protein E5X78_00120 [Mesorhizobium sp.]TIO57792.1 MAG: hypothetical protein E5X79_24490 [Mesorhizobium sp.]TJV60117.1 MAG: hypothetical protein E5X80_23425 [Mesorhizobium sp.]
MHHVSAGNLDERGFGGITILTVAEYRDLSRRYAGQWQAVAVEAVPGSRPVTATIHRPRLSVLPFNEP